MLKRSLLSAPPQVFGTRVIKDRDFRPVQHDPQFLHELNISEKQSVDRRCTYRKDSVEPMANLQTTARLQDPDTPITVYTEAVAKGQYGTTLYGTMPTSNSAPFRKYDNFSKPLSDPNKVLINE